MATDTRSKQSWRPWWSRLLDRLDGSPRTPRRVNITPLAPPARAPRPPRQDVTDVTDARFRSTALQSTDRAEPITPLTVGALAGTERPPRGPRRTVDSGQYFYGISGVIQPPLAPESTWRLQSLDEDALRSLSPAKLMTLLADLSPEVSRAFYDFLRLCNPGWTLTAYRGSGSGNTGSGGSKSSRTPYARAQAALDGHIRLLNSLYGNADVAFNKLFASAWLRGAFFAEAVFGPDYRLVDLTQPDPITVRFRTTTDPLRGQVWQLGQIQPWVSLENAPAARGTGPGAFVALDYPNIRYVPVDPFPGSPYGRPLCSPALFSTLFLLGLLHDLRRVVAQQGYPRLDVSIDLEKLRSTMPADEEDDPTRFREWVEASIADVRTAYASLQPDDTYVHTDVLTVNRPVGAVDASVVKGIDDLLRALERMAIRALKTMPLSMATGDATSDAAANRQWEMQAAGVKALQHLCETMLSDLFQLALQMEGIAAHVAFRFAELRASEELRDQQTLNLKVLNWRMIVASRWANNDEAAQEVVGHPAVDPNLVIALPTGGTATTSGGSPGGNGGAPSAPGSGGEHPAGQPEPSQVPETAAAKG